MTYAADIGLDLLQVEVGQQTDLSVSDDLRSEDEVVIILFVVIIYAYSAGG
jgi:hypothetical protein